jgi:hypothetical protein
MEGPESSAARLMMRADITLLLCSGWNQEGNEKMWSKKKKRSTLSHFGGILSSLGSWERARGCLDKGRGGRAIMACALCATATTPC